MIPFSSFPSLDPADAVTVSFGMITLRGIVRRVPLWALRWFDCDARRRDGAATRIDDITANRDYYLLGTAEVQFKQALDLDPNYATGHQWYGEYLVHTGRLDEGLQELNRARELDPTSPIISALVGQVFYLQRRYDEAIRQYHLTLELDRDFVIAHWLLGVAYLENSMHEAAIASIERAHNLSGGSQRFRALLAAAYARSGNKRAAQGVLKSFIAKPGPEATHAGNMAIVYTALGDKESAFEWLEKAYLQHSDLMLYLRVDSFYDSLRSDPRFAELLRRVGPAE